MKIFKLLAVALVAMCGLASCSKDCDHDFIEKDYSKAFEGIWTCLDGDYAEALVIKEDGSVETTGVVDGEYFESKGTIKVVNNKMTYTLENGDAFEGRFEMIAGESFSMVFDEESDLKITYRRCEKDLSRKILGMWVCTDGPSDETDDMSIHTYQEDGKVILTGFTIGGNYLLNQESTYKVVGDLLFTLVPGASESDESLYSCMRIVYTPRATRLGDIMTTQGYLPVDGAAVWTTQSFLLVKQSLDLSGMMYDYSSSYITNAKGVDKDIQFLSSTFNFAKMDGSIIDKFLKSVIYGIKFPDANTIEYNFLLEDRHVVLQLPIEVDGNKVTIKMSTRNAAYSDIVVYAFQDADNSQLHMYMPTTSFENFFSNLSLSILSASGQVDINNQVHVGAVYQEVADAIHSINVSIVMK